MKYNKSSLGNKRLDSSPAERDLGIVVDEKSSMSQQYTLADRRANCILVCIKYSIGSWSREGIFPLVLCGLTLNSVHSFGCTM